MNPDRKKRRQALRRTKRDVLQNTMALHGWVPVRHKGSFGIYHDGMQKMVTRNGRRYEAGPALPSSIFLITECSWSEMQATWMRGLRAVAVQNGWMT